MARESEQILGPDHSGTLTARSNLAMSYWQAGRTTDAIAILERVAADSERILGPSHPTPWLPNRPWSGGGQRKPARR
jgi:hypothetical protein